MVNSTVEEFTQQTQAMKEKASGIWARESDGQENKQSQLEEMTTELIISLFINIYNTR